MWRPKVSLNRDCTVCSNINSIYKWHMYTIKSIIDENVLIIILPETSIRISRNKSIINYISCVEIQSAQGENTGTWTDQISIQFPDTTDPLKLGPIIIDVKQSNCQSHLRLTPVKSIKKIRSIKLWSFMSRYTHALLSFPRSFLAVNHHNKKKLSPIHSNT